MTIHNSPTIHVTQRPGEDGEHLAQRIVEISDQQIQRRLDDAAAGLSSTQ